MSVSPAPGRAQRPTARVVGSWVVAGALAAVLLYYSLRGIEWGKVWGLILHARWAYLLAGMAISMGTFFLRSLRWRILLNATGNLSVGTVFWATMAGYLGNNFLPARAGEVVRSFAISGQSKLTKTYVLTTALMERVIDAIVLVLCGSVILIGVSPKPDWMNQVSRSVALIAAAGAVGIAALPYLHGLAGRILSFIPLPHAIRDRLAVMLEQMVEGVRALHHGGRFAGFAILTALIWAGDACGVVIGVKVFGITISLAVAMLLLVGMGLGSALPSTPGYVGIYQFVTVTVLTPFGVDRNSALAYILVAQAASYVLVLVFGLIGLYRLRRQAA